MQQRIDYASVEFDLLKLVGLAHHLDELAHMVELPQHREEEPSTEQQKDRQHDIGDGLREVALEFLARDRKCIAHRLSASAASPTRRYGRRPLPRASPRR